MGLYYYPEENMECGLGSTGHYLKNDITIVSTAIDEATAETFTTGVGKLLTPDNAESWPEFDPTYNPAVDVVELQDYSIRLVRDSISVDPDTLALTFKAYIAGVGTPPASGTYKFNLSVQG